MAYYWSEPSLLFNHMPFCGGMYVVKNLPLGPNNRIGSMHDLAVMEWRPKTTFVTIRHPELWYRSAFFHMRKNWRAGGTDSELWNSISSMMVQCRDERFEGWMVNVYRYYPGLWTWCVNVYSPPGTLIIPIWQVSDWVMSEFGAKMISDKPFNMHAVPGDRDYEITDRVKSIVKLMEDSRLVKLTHAT